MFASAAVSWRRTVECHTCRVRRGGARQERSGSRPRRSCQRWHYAYGDRLTTFALNLQTGSTRKRQGGAALAAYTAGWRHAICKSRDRHRRLGSREGLQPCATLRRFDRFKCQLAGDERSRCECSCPCSIVRCGASTLFPRRGAGGRPLATVDARPVRACEQRVSLLRTTRRGRRRPALLSFVEPPAKTCQSSGPGLVAHFAMPDAPTSDVILSLYAPQGAVAL